MSSPQLEDNETSTSSDCDGVFLLGCDIPINDIPESPLQSEEDGRFVRLRCPTAVIDWGGRPRVLREKAMMSMMAALMCVSP